MVRLLGFLFFGALAGVLVILAVGLYGMQTSNDRPDTGGPATLRAEIKPGDSGLNTTARKRFTGANAAGRDRFRKVKAPTRTAPPKTDGDAAKSWVTDKIDRYTRSKPPVYYLWRDGYRVGDDLTKWDETNREALAAYLRDWGLPAEEPDAEGWLSAAAMDRLDRSDRATKPQWVTVKIPACKVWIEDLMPGEKTTWDGVCHGRTAGGEGTLTREFVRQGRRVKAGFIGTLLDGKAQGYGRTITVRGLIYEGMHVKGRFHGEGVLFLARTGEEIYRGEFKEGFPHGDGRYTSPDGPVEGSWEMGCLDQGGTTAAILRHASECVSEPGVLTGVIGKLFD